jgi:hypothetical protein
MSERSVLLIGFESDDRRRSSAPDAASLYRTITGRELADAAVYPDEAFLHPRNMQSELEAATHIVAVLPRLVDGDQQRMSGGQFNAIKHAHRLAPIKEQGARVLAVVGTRKPEYILGQPWEVPEIKGWLDELGVRFLHTAAVRGNNIRKLFEKEKS